MHTPEGAAKKHAVVIVVGGPKYGVGSHRQFVTTARYVAAAGYPVLRFDYPSKGDSSYHRKPQRISPAGCRRYRFQLYVASQVSQAGPIAVHGGGGPFSGLGP